MECGSSISNDGYGQDRDRIMAILAQDANTDRKDPPDTTLNSREAAGSGKRPVCRRRWTYGTWLTLLGEVPSSQASR